MNASNYAGEWRRTFDDEVREMLAIARPYLVWASYGIVAKAFLVLGWYLRGLHGV